MIKIIKKKINMSDELKTKIDWSCKFSKQKYKIYEGCLRIVEHTNLAYVEPHKVIINNQLYLFFNEQKYFVNDIIRMYKKCNIKMHNIVHSFCYTFYRFGGIT